MSLAEFSSYQDCWGLNQLATKNWRGQVTENGALFTLEYLICLMEDKGTTLEMKLIEINRLKSVYDSLELNPGLTLRDPGSSAPDSMDNNTASLVFSSMFNGGAFARRMRDHGLNVKCEAVENDDSLDFYPIAWILNGFKRPKNFWNNINPTHFITAGWFGRSPGFMGLLDIAATGSTTWFRYLALAIGQFWGCFQNRNNTDARKLPYIVWYLLADKNQFWRLAYWIWVRILLWQYPNGMRDVYAIYYQDPNHPIRKYSKRYFGEVV